MFHSLFDDPNSFTGQAAATKESVDQFVKPVDYARAAMAKEREAANLLGIEPPKHWTEDAIEREGGLKFFGKMLLGGMTGMTPLLFPEMMGSKERYKQDLSAYNDQLENQRLSQLASPYEEMLSNNSTEDDLKGIQALARLYPEIYGPVLRDMQQQAFAPKPATFTEGEYQFDPNYTDESSDKPGRWYLETQGSDGSVKRQYRSKDFIPQSRMPGAEYIQKGIEKADGENYRANGVIAETGGIIQRMDEIGEANWLAGVAGKGSEWIKSVMGTEDFVTSVRKQYSDIKVRSAINNLPPGVASDKDIQLVLEPWPEDTSNWRLIRDKLEAIQRVEQGRAEYALFESSWLAEKGSRSGLQKAWLQTKRGSETSKSNQEAKKPRYEIVTPATGG